MAVVSGFALIGFLLVIQTNNTILIEIMNYISGVARQILPYSTSRHYKKGSNMQTLNQQEIDLVSGGAWTLDPELGLFPRTGIALIDKIHANEWNAYGKYLYAAGAYAAGLLGSSDSTPAA